MNKTEFMEAMRRIRFQMLNGASAVGVIAGTPVTAVNQAAYVVLRIVLDRPAGGTQKKALRDALKGFVKVGQAGRNTLVLSVRPASYSGPAHEAFLTAVNAVKEAGLSADGVCPLCREGNCDAAAPLGADFRLVHRGCLQRKIDSSRERMERNEQNGNYLLGILGAFLGMVVGCIPSLLMVIASDRIYALLFALIPICSYYGYKLLGGKMNGTARIVSVIMSVLSVYVMIFAQLGYQVMDLYDTTLPETAAYLGSFLSDGSFWLEITKEAVMYFVFIALGVLFSWRLISGTASGETVSAEKSLEYAIQYPVRYRQDAERDGI